MRLVHSESIRVLIVDDHALVREGVRRVLEEDGSFDVVREAADGEEALAALRDETIDVALIDISMPGTSGLELVREIRQLDLPVRTLVLSMHDKPEYVERAVEAGADGYLLKDEAGPAELRSAVRAVQSGHSAFSPRVTRRLATALQEQRGRSIALARLTGRERQILRLVARGLTSRQIGQDLRISPRTVETHRQNIMRKLEVRNVAGLTRVALHLGLLDEGSA